MKKVQAKLITGFEMNIEEIYSCHRGRDRDNFLHKDRYHSFHKEGIGDCSAQKDLSSKSQAITPDGNTLISDFLFQLFKMIVIEPASAELD